MPTDPVTWPREDHTKAKHEVLRAFFDKWVSVHSSYFAQRGEGLVRVYDGFAGPGIYDGGEPGSPRILVEALLENDNLLSRWQSVRYEFSFVEQDGRRVESLRSVLAEVERTAREDGRWSDRITWSVTHGRYEEHTPAEPADLSALFLFLDPFGYTQAPMSLTGQLVRQPKCDTLIFLLLSFIHRFADQASVDAAIDAFFGTPDWRNIRSGKERPSAMRSLFRAQLRERGLRYTGEFRLRPADNNNEYWLVGASGDPRGFESLKEAFWRVDRVNGQGYDAPRLRRVDQQEVLFAEPVRAISDEPNTDPLLEELNYNFNDEWFSVEQAIEFTETRTRFLESHLRRRTLQPAEASGLLYVERSGATGFTVGKGIRMRFAQRVALEDPSGM
jgi:three-Cys-motif partner protein